MQSGTAVAAADIVNGTAAADATARDGPARHGTREGSVMNETTVCVTGNVATQPVYRETAAGASSRFRLAVTARYWDREKNAWTDGHTNFFTVWSRRALATNVQASVTVGDPVVVHGRLRVRTEVREGHGWASADIDATAVGHDLARGTSAFRRAAKGGTAKGDGTAPAAGPEPGRETGPALPGQGRETAPAGSDTGWGRASAGPDTGWGAAPAGPGTAGEGEGEAGWAAASDGSALAASGDTVPAGSPV